MKLSEDRISHLSHLVCDALYHDDLVDYTDDDEALLCIRRSITEYVNIEDQIDDVVRQKIQSLSRGVPEGSREWDIMYRKYYEEEAQKRRF